ncbi:MAG: hypothetical protein E7079_00040 [Bacteroidales bacterium]|nr:hypothetical protein [Bacteroidales bacterium]
MKTNNNLDNFLDIRVVNLLTPRFAPTTSLEFKAPAPRRRTLWQVARIGAVAAMVAVAVVIVISGVQTSTARDVVERALTQLLESDNCLVRFTANVTANKSSQEELYDIDFDGTPMQGTVEIRKDNSKIKMAIKWQDQARSMELYDGESYRRYQNGQLVLERPHGEIDLTPFSTIDKLNEYSLLMGILLKFREEGDIVIVSTRGDKVGIIARFSKSEGRLLGAECSGLYNGQQVTVLTVDQIDFDVPSIE